MADGGQEPVQRKPPPSWWLVATLGAPLLNFLALFGLFVAAKFTSPVLTQLWWLLAIALLAPEYLAFRRWGDRLGLARGWAISGAGFAVALGLVLATLVLVVAVVSCDGCTS